VELVRRELPEVEVIHLAKGDRPRLSVILAECGLFDTLTVSAEDRQRGEMYQAEAIRKKLLTETTDMEGYYKTLEMEATVALADKFTFPRVAQQTQKTNQFNLTTRRYSEEDIERYAASGTADVLCLKLADRFGDSGIVGTCILAYNGDTAVIDTLLLSCRALGRRVEDVFLAAILQRAKARGAAKVLGTFIPTRKNSQVEEFYPGHGFVPTETQGTQGEKSYVYDLDAPPASSPSFFKKIEILF
jgi:FkbH-like protein